MGLRADLAAAIDAATPDGVTVYDHPADVVAIPAIVIDPTDPWIEPATMGSWRWALVLHLVHARGDVSSALDWIEARRVEIQTALDGFGAQVGGLGAPDQIEVGEIETIQADLAVEIVTDRTS